ncbi:MAG: hypothetical protein ACREK3_09915 [Gemmatimonadota bacterium]
MRELATGVHGWSVHSERLGYDLNGFAWRANGETVVVDPPELTPAAERFFDSGGWPDLIVVTNRTHWRATDALRERSGAAVALSAVDADAVEGAVDRALAPGEELPGGWRVLDMAGKSLGEIGLFREAERGVLLLGDSLIGDPPGRLRLLPDSKIDDRDLLLVSLARIATLEFEVLLLGDGTPVLEVAAERVRAFLRSL